jgi:hypothetical protein
MSFHLFDVLKELVFLPVWNYVVTAILGSILGGWFAQGRPSSSAKRRLASRDFSVNRPMYDSPIRVEVSVTEKNLSQGSDTLWLAVLLTLIYIPLRFWILNGLAIVTGLSFGFSLAVCLVLVKRSRWRGEHRFVIGCLIFGCLILITGLWLAWNPPRVPSLAVAAALAYGSIWQGITLPNLALNWHDWTWIGLHAFGFFFLVFPARAMVSLGLGTVASSMAWKGGFWRFVGRVLSYATDDPVQTALWEIILGGLLALAFLGGWVYDLLQWLLKFQSSLKL